MTTLARGRSVHDASASLWLALLAFLGTASALIWARLDLPSPGCAFRAWTGLPCATCGTTRMFRALAAGDLASAFAANPVLLGLLAATIAWATYSLARVLSGRGVPTIPSSLRSRAGLVLALLLFFASWAYQLWRALA